MNRELFLAILSMDSYNRGYGRGIKFSVGESTADRTDFGVQIGNATIQNVDLPSGSKAAGFYALAYNWNGETIIAYRGSDSIDKGVAFANLLLRNQTLGIAYIPTAEDVTNGYGVAFGYTTGPQARLAVEFYKAVAGGDVDPRTRTVNNISVTGHSLGAGLSGLIADIYSYGDSAFKHISYW